MVAASTGAEGSSTESGRAWASPVPTCSTVAEAAGAIKRRVICDIATRGLVYASEDADLFVVGTRGRSGLGEFILGSVAHHLTKHARCPVVVVPAARAAAA